MVLHILTQSPNLIGIRSIFNTLRLELSDQSIQLSTPQIFEPICVTEPFNQCGTHSVVGTDECPSIPSGGQCVISESAERPNLGAIIGTIDTGSNIAATVATGAGGTAGRMLTGIVTIFFNLLDLPFNGFLNC